MMLTDDKILHLSHVILKGLIGKKLIEVIEEEGKVRAEIKRAVISELKIGEEIDSVVRRKLQSFSRKIVEGSSEWEILYKKFFREEEVKRGRASG
ncbi:MAG: DUF507 domain-containing protein [Nitrospirae bacterium CG_4_10_14_0_8_um_filter_41_23]|nr:DUF507 family protein [Nitrospirota bacterium]PIQ94659.1 MAG: hypothetical protein COV68_03475 [Nitrospirae bacterium CG11_big_fil_rev_8_21_14_0_20_41_14]PIV41119.1 MAG: DUF507 domain-containing protein [Nitrospirae bacterium CG02_land_8_20_14_3_00_41_53]PIW88114.1 MAG: DUF507 domain-containing protein [Nitrospirae bacterium CG_4_8_14_3_um_filter_41_47]PIY87379.1 MAG: DUF507 domain-containing protein [Nitrospirae bacterium CG_4_10_14_0_8_um_filter_41_23]PJA79714.1 MAG: DUF507 domain-contain